MDGPRDYHTKRCKSEKDKYNMISLICGISKKNDTNELIYKIQTHKKQIYVTKGKGIKLGIWG